MQDSHGVPVAQKAIPPEARSDLDSARTLTLIAMIFQAIFAILGIFILFLILVSFTVFYSPYTIHAAASSVQLQMPRLIFLPLILVTGFGVLPLVLLRLTYFLVYKRLSEGRVEEAVAPALAIGIISLVLGGLISGILLIIAYVKAKDAHTKIVYSQQQGLR
jgi:hypothetical protein